MVRLKFLLYYSMVLILLQNCREPFDVEVPAGNSLLVVNGMITDHPGPYMIKLSRSSPLGSLDFPAESGASVAIESASGEIENLVEASEGYYFTSEDGIRGEIGEQYRVSIQTRHEETYQSDWKLLKQSPPIDSVYFTYKEEQAEEGLLQGIQTFVDTHDPTNKTEYYRYDWIETWHYTVPYSPQYEYLGNDSTSVIEKKAVCWIEQPSTSIDIASSTQNDRDIISRHPILFITTQTPRLRILYSLLVNQYALDQDEYLFWKGLKETVNESGTLFDKQPQSIIGNIHRINSDEPVLGYFSASSISAKRIFMDRSDLPEDTQVDVSLFNDCLVDTYIIEKSSTSDKEVFNALDRGLVFYDFYREFVNISGYIITTVPCSDCTYHGGALEKPDYWPE